MRSYATGFLPHRDHLDDSIMRVKHTKNQPENQFNFSPDEISSRLKHDSTNNSIQYAPTFVELHKFEKFSMVWLLIHKIQKPIDLLVSFIQELKQILKCSKCTLFVTDKQL
mmetsp:Transcript_2918/g.2754  ORF Transcript_2918/g.2754 Transcript_2918/m.2754 type:complete len:111 (+) Transcript_2918:1428-1760(+)